MDSNRDGSIIRKADWERHVLPGMHVAMSIVVRDLLAKFGKCPKPGCSGVSAQRIQQKPTVW